MDLEYKLQLSIKENGIIKQKCDSHVSSVARKEQLVKDLEILISQLRQKNREEKEILKQEN